MKSSLPLTICVLISVVGVSLLGFFAMALDSDHSHGRASCIAIIIQGSACPEDSTALSFISFHLNAFSSLTQGVPQDFSGILAFFILALLLASRLVESRAVILNTVLLASPRYPLDHFSNFPPSGEHLTRWFFVRQRLDLASTA